MKKQDVQPGGKKAPARSRKQKSGGKLDGPGLLKVEDLEQATGGDKNANNGGGWATTKQ